MTVPPAAIHAAAEALAGDHGCAAAAHERTARAALEAAAPFIAEAEAERIRHLATRHTTTSSKCAAGLAVHPSCQCAAATPAFPFADLLEPAP